MLEIFTPVFPLPGFEFRALAAVAFTAAAAYYDIFNRKWVPDYIAYAAVGLSLAANLLFFSQAVFLQAIIFGSAIFLPTYFLYRAGQLGGADVYVLTGIASAIPFLPAPLLSPQQHVPYPFILSVLVPTGLAFILHMLLRFIPKMARALSHGEIRLGAARFLEALALCAVLVVFAKMLSTLPIPLPQSYLAVFAVLAASLFFFSTFKREIKASMAEMVNSSDLAEEDVLAMEQIDPKTAKALSLAPLLDKAMIARVKKSRIKALPVYTGMPFFLPYLLFGLLFALLFGDVFFLLS
jgi:Flp pilus assembly protein protease CpaA